MSLRGGKEGPLGPRHLLHQEQVTRVCSSLPAPVVLAALPSADPWETWAQPPAQSALLCAPGAAGLGALPPPRLAPQAQSAGSARPFPSVPCFCHPLPSPPGGQHSGGPGGLRKRAAWGTPWHPQSLSPCYVSAEGELGAEEEGFENLNTMASTFIVLFLLSLFYSTTVTLFKVGRQRGAGWGPAFIPSQERRSRYPIPCR